MKDKKTSYIVIPVSDTAFEDGNYVFAVCTEDNLAQAVADAVFRYGQCKVLCTDDSSISIPNVAEI